MQYNMVSLRARMKDNMLLNPQPFIIMKCLNKKLQKHVCVYTFISKLVKTTKSNLRASIESLFFIVILQFYWHCGETDFNDLMFQIKSKTKIEIIPLKLT